jgi:hypothetical protein
MLTVTEHKTRVEVLLWGGAKWRKAEERGRRQARGEFCKDGSYCIRNFQTRSYALLIIFEINSDEPQPSLDINRAAAP